MGEVLVLEGVLVVIKTCYLDILLVEGVTHSISHSFQPLSLLSNMSLNLNNSKPLARRSWPDA